MSPSKTWSSKKPASLNKLTLPGSVWLASDIHLGPHLPKTRAGFIQFLHNAAQQADALILLGDLFEVWTGDDIALQRPEPWLAEIMAALRNTGDRIPLYIGRGNRDFLIGRPFCRAVGAKLLPDTMLVTTDLGDVLISHGDEYCTDDKAYQRFRRLVRLKWLQRLFLILGTRQREKLANYARNRSRAHNQMKSADIMDVSQKSVAQAFSASHVRLMVHGHTHRPGTHETQQNGLTRTRIVLPDWELDAATPRGGWLTIDGHEARLHDFVVDTDTPV